MGQCENLTVAYVCTQASQVVLVVKNLPANAGDTRDVGSISGSGRFQEGGNGNPLQYSCWEIPWRGAWEVAVWGSDMAEHARTHIYPIPTVQEAGSLPPSP